MIGPSKNRIMKEFQDWNKNADKSNIKVNMVGDDIYHWKGIIEGPVDTPYHKGIFVIDIIMNTEYPYKPPKMKFETKIWHPNISSQTGAICLDILKNEWSPALSIRTALLSLQALLQDAEPDDPQDAVVASQYKSNYESFKQTAREWTQKYANDDVNQEKISKLVEMGFDKTKCQEAIQKFAGDENLALNYLLGGM